MRRHIGQAFLSVTFGLFLIASGSAMAAERAAPGAVLDPSFGDRGLVRLSDESAFSARGLKAGGNLLVSGGSHIQVLNGRGSTGRAFGADGSLRLPTDGGRFEFGDFTIDPQGRLLVVGTVFVPESENPSPYLENGARAFRPGLLRILRFLPNGHLDPAFGRGGVVETDLGLPPPVGSGGDTLGTQPAIETTGVTVGPQGLIVVTGGAVSRLGETCEHDSFAEAAVAAGYVARFTSSGLPDSTFGAAGLVGGHDLGENSLGAEKIGDPVVDPRGGITYRSLGAYVCERSRSHLGIGQLTADGDPRESFGRNGAIVGRFLDLAEGSHGAVLALAEEPRHEKDPVRARLLQVAPNGRLDRSFGKGGRATVELAPSLGTTLNSLAVEDGGEILIGGTLETGAKRSIVLLRVSSQGRWDKSFGPHGRVATPVAQLTRFGSSDLFFDARNRLVTVHQHSEERHRGPGLIIARYLLRR